MVSMSIWKRALGELCRDYTFEIRPDAQLQHNSDYYIGPYVLDLAVEDSAPKADIGPFSITQLWSSAYAQAWVSFKSSQSADGVQTSQLSIPMLAFTLVLVAIASIAFHAS